MKYIFAILVLLACSTGTAAEKVFRLHLANEPGGLDPNKQRTSSSSYLLTNLYRNIFSFDDSKGLTPDLGEGCKRDKKNATLTCTLKKDLTWSDGSPITSADFLQTYKKILNPKTAAPRADLLFSIKNAEEVYAGKKPVDSLGVSAPDKTTLKFELSKVDPDFEHNLANYILAPTKEKLDAYTGPYKLKEWKRGQKIVLESNRTYKMGHPDRPLVEVLFIEEDTVALQLYEKNELQFLRRLPTLFIPSYKKRSDFYWVPVSRLDYIGFGPELANQEDVRKAFTYSLNYVELQKIFSSEGRPGCIGLPDSWFPEKAPCFDYDLKKVPKVKSDKTYNMMFSALGGEDHKRATEWLQNQWSKNAGLKTHLEVKENKVFLQILGQNPPALFRKGVAADRPTCLAALETFGPLSPENYLRIKSPEYDKLLANLGKAKTQAEQKNACLAGTEYLMKNHLMIPLGAIQFSILVKPEFTGWKLNQLNQLDLANLKAK
ncbi:peptide ABC transporter substrate-binding protein [Bdellovibrio reynosensis]|uniref:Peptide ABC transporter substrate-binding protein n=1 Tax=Bdellovibrio reynosensis TaxID=2835041 RepID=A0ABY4CER3_9BACT|nr:peptide ABC transporter substrate-binding protein [Bdellovibrio reynosensis]UOF02038.1 peptide ABC transporter substrate-binding protein [Bdellovibrio reynosensis]